MADYIDRDAVYDAILIDGGLNAYEKAYCIDVVRKIPAADAQRVAASHISAGTEETKTMNKSTLGQYGKKLLTIAKIIYLETDRDNPIKVKELRECAEQFGVTLPKSSVYRYIDTINENLFPVKNIPWHGFYRAGDIK